MSAWMRVTIIARRAGLTRFKSRLQRGLRVSRTMLMMTIRKQCEATYIVHVPTIPIHIMCDATIQY